MTETLISDTTLVANAFFLDIDGKPLTMLTGVSGLESGVEVTEVVQTSAQGKMIAIRTLGAKQKTNTLTLTRLAVVKSEDDGIWKWFKSTSEKGSLKDARKTGAIVIFGADGVELARWSFTGGWVSKIAFDSLDVGTGSPVKETITLETDTLVRTK
ncbi:MAG: hypothetical protein QG597_3665 [Actinomycetota bacterium]|nr:hypothetical protein [Actinomycetota bacterium]